MDVERKLPPCLVLSLSVKSLMQLLVAQAPCRQAEERGRRRDASCALPRCSQLLCLSGFHCAAGADAWSEELTLKAREAEVNALGRGELSRLILLPSHLCFESIVSLRVPGSLLLQDVHAALTGGRHFQLAVKIRFALSCVDLAK